MGQDLVGRKHRKYLLSQLTMSFVVVAILAIYFFRGGIFSGEEEMVEQHISPPLRAKPHRAPKRLVDFLPAPLSHRFFNKNPLSVTDVQQSLHSIALMQLSRPPRLDISQSSYEWIAGLTPEHSYSVIHYLKRLPVENWEAKLSYLRHLPPHEVHRQVSQRGHGYDCRGDHCSD